MVKLRKFSIISRDVPLTLFPSYKGDPGELRMWLTQMRQVFMHQRVPQHEWLPLMVNKLEGDARVIFLAEFMGQEDEPHPFPQYDTWGELKEIFQRRLGVQESVVDIERRFTKHLHWRGDILQFIAILRRLQAVTEVPEELVIRHAHMALDNAQRKMARLVLHDNPRTIVQLEESIRRHADEATDYRPYQFRPFQGDITTTSSATGLAPLPAPAATEHTIEQLPVQQPVAMDVNRVDTRGHATRSFHDRRHDPRDRGFPPRPQHVNRHQAGAPRG